jgi:hypothetical protein
VVEKMRSKKSILFVRPDFHCSFFYREELRKQGWKADIFVNPGYPLSLLYSTEDIKRGPRLPGTRFKILLYLNHALVFLWWLGIFWRYEYHLYYGRPPVFPFFEDQLGLSRLFGRGFLIELWLAKLFGVKLLYLPTGCHDDDTKQTWGHVDEGNVCGNCGFFNRCDDSKNKLNFDRIRRYFSLAVGFGNKSSKEMRECHLKYKAIDLNKWKPGMEIPLQHRLPKVDKIRVLHSSYLSKSGRDWGGRNIKGTPFVVAAVERLKSEGYPVEYFFVENKPSNEMRFYQSQADIVVEQLIYGWWGSTGVETMALAKPVVCYIRPSWKTLFLKTFPEYSDLPVVEARTSDIYDVLKRLVTDESYRRQKGEESRIFAEKHFDPVENTRALIRVLEGLSAASNVRSNEVGNKVDGPETGREGKSELSRPADASYSQRVNTIKS